MPRSFPERTLCSSCVQERPLTRTSRNFIYSKKFFWFGSEPVDVKKFPALLKDHHLAAWASETGKGLLFVSDKGTDKTAPTSAIPLVSHSSVPSSCHH